MSAGAPAANRAGLSTPMDVFRSRKVGKGRSPAGLVRNRFQKFVENFRKFSILLFCGVPW